MVILQKASAEQPHRMTDWMPRRGQGREDDDLIFA
jgi:hypothetical protein